MSNETCADQEEGGGEQGVQTPLENYQNIGFLRTIGPDPLKITKLPIQHSMLGHHPPVSETPFKWCFAGGLLMAPHSGIWILPPLIYLKKKKKKKTSKLDPLWQNFLGPRMRKIKLTVCIRVDSALETRTNTSASTQNLSIHRSKLGVTSIPGLKHGKIKIDKKHC